MNNVILLILIVLVSSCHTQKDSYDATRDFHLAPPLISADKMLFQDSALVALKYSFPGASIRYTLDGSEVTLESPMYNGPISLKKTGTVTAKNFHPDFQSSPAASLHVVHLIKTLRTASVSIAPEPHPKYSGNGANTLTDSEKGSLQFGNNHKWLGFQTDTVNINIDFPKPEKVSKVVLSTMADHSSWIFMPTAIFVFSGEKEVGSKLLAVPENEEESQLQFVAIEIAEQDYNNLKIMVFPLKTIPEWHAGKGTSAWFFMDEVLIE